MKEAQEQSDDEQSKDDALTRSRHQSLTSRSAALVRRGLAEAMTLESRKANYMRYFVRGTVKRRKGDYDGAIADFNRAMEINPRNAVGYCIRGRTKEKTGDYDGAIADYTRAIGIIPRWASPYYSRGRAKGKKGDYEGAIDDYDRAIEIKPEWASSYYNRGGAKFDQGGLDSAKADFSQASKIDTRKGVDPERYAKAKPYFEAGIAPYLKEGKNLTDSLKGLVHELLSNGLIPNQIEEMIPHILRFMAEKRAEQTEVSASEKAEID